MQVTTQNSQSRPELPGRGDGPGTSGGQPGGPDSTQRGSGSALRLPAALATTASGTKPGPAGSPAISVRDLSVSFAGKPVLQQVSLEIPHQAVTAIIGPSGCGKSTFLRALNRMHDLVPSARVQGEILLFGENILARDIEPVMVRRRVGMVFQKSNPFPTMSIAENVTVGLRLNGTRDRVVLHDRTKQALAMAALWDEVKDRLDAPAVSLSGGQQQRLCIARALAVQPEVLLMDEPASALDPLATARIEDLILDLKKKYTIVIVTHNMQQAARISDHTAFFYLGELVEYGTTSRLFNHPAKKRTEDYVTGRFG
ncbi:MAG TPA: phosphate ABC transporter ATP-binding protein PstB [Verrucomicrobiae bacterium]